MTILLSVLLFCPLCYLSFLPLSLSLSLSPYHSLSANIDPFPEMHSGIQVADDTHLMCIYLHAVIYCRDKRGITCAKYSQHICIMYNHIGRSTRRVVDKHSKNTVLNI